MIGKRGGKGPEKTKSREGGANEDGQELANYHLEFALPQE